MSAKSVWKKLAQQFGTPLYVIDASGLDRSFKALRSALPSDFEIHYSVKANPAPAVLQEFLRLGAGLEVASLGEFQLAISSGARPQQVLFAGPNKRDGELHAVVEAGIGQVHVESLQEAQRLSAIAVQFDRHQQVALRINPAEQVAGGAMRMGGIASPFGVDEECMEQTLLAIDALPNLDLVGIHQFAATQVLDAERLLLQWKHAIQLGQRFADVLGRAPSVIDVGGGLGIPLYADDSELDLQELSEGCRRLPRLPHGCKLILEPGRFLVGPSGVYLCRVDQIKTSRGRSFLLVDGGMHHHLAASGNLGQVIKRDMPMQLIRQSSPTSNPSTETEATEFQVCGPLCTPLDVLARKFTVAHPAVGDLIAIQQSGAYAASASPLHFLSHPAPAEVLVRASGEVELMRPAGTGRQPVPDYLYPPVQTSAQTNGRCQ